MMGERFCDESVGVKKDGYTTHISKLSFHDGLSDFFVTLVEHVCSPSTVRTANGSGRLRRSLLTRPWAPNTAINGKHIRYLDLV